MNRIFFTLAVFSLLVMAAALGLGLGIGDLQSDQPEAAAIQWARVHRLTGLAAALAVVFVQSIVVTYFIGTSRWVKEVSQTYRLDTAMIRESAQLKRRAFPWSLTAMLVVVGVGALGAAADPATRRVGTENWTTIHLVAAMAGLGFVGWSYLTVWNLIHANQEVIARVMDQVRDLRKERGLDEVDETVESAAGE